MAKNAVTHPPAAQSAAEEPASSRPSLAPIIEINVRHIGRKPQAERLIGATAPEGWIKKVDRPREGKVWVGYFHLYVADPLRTNGTQEKGENFGPLCYGKCQLAVRTTPGRRLDHNVDIPAQTG